MNVNSDFSETVALKSNEIDWKKSPMPGVDRRMLDRMGDEVARATTIVRYAPESSFSAHTHSGGEEFIVLEGTFQDEHGDYPAGTYVRNPIGTGHTPRSNQGCTIFVKLWQFDPNDDDQFHIDMNQAALEQDPDDSAIRRMRLHEFGDELVELEEWAAEAVVTIESNGGVELLVLAGTIEFEGDTYSQHDWIRLPADKVAVVRAGSEGARIWKKSGHLRNVVAPKA